MPRESDRRRFVELFCDREFMIFCSGVLAEVTANERFDAMVARAMIHPRNTASQSVAQKVGFAFWKREVVDGLPADGCRLQVRGDLAQ